MFNFILRKWEVKFNGKETWHNLRKTFAEWEVDKIGHDWEKGGQLWWYCRNMSETSFGFDGSSGNGVMERNRELKEREGRIDKIQG